MKPRIRFLTSSIQVVGWALVLTVVASQADVITQTVNQNTTTGTAPGWNLAIWGTPAATPTPGNAYLIPSGFTLRTPNYTTNSMFSGDLLISTNGGSIAFKHSTGTATVHLVIGPGSLSHAGGAGSGVIPPSPLAGTIQAIGNINYSGSASTTPQPRHLLLLSTLTGAGNFIIGNCYTSSVYLANSGTAYTGNWTNNGGRLEIVGGNSPLGSGVVHLSNPTNTLTLNSYEDMVFSNLVTGEGGLVKNHTNAVFLRGDHAFTGTLSVNNGLLVLLGTGTQFATTVNNTGILRVANSGAIPAGCALSVTANNPQTARLELSNNVTIATGIQIPVSMRGNATYPNSSVAIQSISGNNIIQDQIGIQSGGGFLGIQVDAGSTLDLQGGVSSIATGGRNFTLLGDGNGTVSGTIDNGNASSVALNKSGAGTWTLSGFNFYTGATHITNGVLKLAASASIDYSPAIGIDPEGTFDAASIPAGLVLAANQILRGSGRVVGDVTTSPGSLIEVGFLNQYGQLTLANNLVLNGGETNRFEIGQTNDTLNLSGNLTLNGITTIQIAAPEGFINNGTYRLINYGGSLQGTGSFQLVSPGSRQTFTLDTATPHQVNLLVSGASGDITWSGDSMGNVWDLGTTRNWNAQSDFFYNGDRVTFNDSGSTVPEIDVAQPVLVESMAVNNSTKVYTFNNYGISSFGTLTKTGGNVLALANDGNNFRGLIRIEEGILSVGNGGITGSLGTGDISNNGELVVNRLTGGVALPGDISGSGSLRVTGGDANTSLTLSGSNSYTGLTTIDANCSITIQNNNALGDTSIGTKVLSGGRAGFTSLGPWTVAEPLEINGDGLATAPGALYLNTVSNLAIWTGPITVASPARIRVVNNYAKLLLANTVIGNQAPLALTSDGTGTQMLVEDTLSIGAEAVLTKDGSGTVVLAGNSNLCGGTVINAGTLLIKTTNPPQLGDITANGGILQIGDGGPNGSFPPGLINLAGSGAILRLHSSNDLTLGQEITGTGSLSKYGSNTVVILNSNSFWGNVTTGSGSPSPNGRGGGVIELRHQYGLGDGTASKTVELIRSELQLVGGLSIPSLITFNISGGSFATGEGPGLIPIRSVSGNNVIEGNVNLIGGGGSGEVRVDSGSLTIQGTVTANTTGRTLWLSGAGTGTLNGPIMNNGANTPGLLKLGTGAWTLTGASDYSGVTTIQEGELVLSSGASLSGTPTITLLSNSVLNVAAISGGLPLGFAQTLRGNGTVEGSLQANGVVQPGMGIGTLNIAGAITLSGETVMELNRSGAANSDLLAATSIACGGTLTIANLGPDLVPGDTFNLFDGALSGSFMAISLPTLASPDYFWDVSLLESQGIISVGSTTAPPPTILPPTVAGSILILEVNSVAGYTYTLEASPAIDPAAWTVVELKAGGGLLTFSIPITHGVPQRFFRISVQ